MRSAPPNELSLSETLDLKTIPQKMKRSDLFKGPNISQNWEEGRDENAGGERDQKQSKTCAGNNSIKTTKQYYSKNLVIKFNGLLAIGSLQQHSKKCLFSLTSHLYC